MHRWKENTENFPIEIQFSDCRFQIRTTIKLYFTTWLFSLWIQWNTKDININKIIIFTLFITLNVLLYNNPRFTISNQIRWCWRDNCLNVYKILLSLENEDIWIFHIRYSYISIYVYGKFVLFRDIIYFCKL